MKEENVIQNQEKTVDRSRLADRQVIEISRQEEP